MSKTTPDGGPAAVRPSSEPHGAPDAEAAILAELAQDYQTHCAPCFLGMPEHCTEGLAPNGQPCVTTPAQRIAWLLDVVQQVVAQRDAAAVENAALAARLAAVEAQDGRWRALVGALAPFTRHAQGCPLRTNVTMLGCTCGLDALLVQAALDDAAPPTH